MERFRAIALTLVILNVVGFSSGIYYYLLSKEEVNLRESVEALVDRLADELIVVQDQLGNAQVALEESHFQIQHLQDVRIQLQGEIRYRDERIQQMQAQLMRLQSGPNQVDLGQLYVSTPRQTLTTPQSLQPQLEPVIRAQAPRPAHRQAPVVPPSAPSLRDSLPSRALTPMSPVMPSGPVSSEGSILAINEEFNFVIVSLGASHGLKEGMVLSLLRGGQQVENMRVDMVDKTTCAATIILENRVPIQVGDTVLARIS